MAAETVSSDAVAGGLKIDQREAGKVHCRSAKYTNDGAKDANSVIKMVPLPAGARVLRIDGKYSALGSGVTVDIGDSTTIDKYVDGGNWAAAGTLTLVTDVKLVADEDVQIKVLGAAFPDEAVVSLHAYYKMADSIADENE